MIKEKDRRKHIIALFSIFTCFTISFGQDNFSDLCNKIIAAMDSCESKELFVSQGERATYYVDSVLIKDYSTKVIGCYELSEFSSQNGLQTTLVFFQILENDTVLFHQLAASLFLFETTHYRLKDYRDKFAFEQWTPEIAELHIQYWTLKIEQIKIEFPDKCKEIYNGTY